MTKYKIIYPFEVLKRIEDGTNVYMTDRELWQIHLVNKTSTSTVLFAIADKTGRFDFWTKEETEITEEIENEHF